MIADVSETARGWLYVPVLYLTVLVLHRVLPPSEEHEGYACDSITGEPLKYRFNGLSVLAVMVGGYITLVPAHLRGELANCFNPALQCSCLLGLLVSLLLYVDGKRKLKLKLVDRGTCCLTKNSKRTAAAKSTSEFDLRNEFEHYYCGIDWNPRVLGIDIKMYNYLVGSVMLALNILSAFFVHIEKRGEPSISITVYCGCFTIFCVEYLYFENVHVYTYDIFRERTGMKMVWGCFFFYPFFYCCGVWPLVDSDTDIQPLTGVCLVLLYLAGWFMTRGANMQKFLWRTKRSPTFFFGLIQNKCVPGSGDRILCSGFWAASRHINYLGEITQALALALCGYLGGGTTTGTLVRHLPLLYPLYYVCLFVPRQIDDDSMCAKKYGERVWAKYCLMCPYRIVPGLY